jgi:hypothetical protein
MDILMSKYNVEYTDTFGGEPNYCWVKRATITMPELTHYGYTGSTDGSYSKANKAFQRQLMRKAKAAVGITGIAGRTDDVGGIIEFRPYKSCTVMFVTYSEE